MHTCFGGVPDGDSLKNSFKNTGKYNRSLCVQMGLASKRMLIAIFVTHTCFGCAPDGDSFKIIQHPCRQEVFENTSALFAYTWGGSFKNNVNWQGFSYTFSWRARWGGQKMVWLLRAEHFCVPDAVGGTSLRLEGLRSPTVPLHAYYHTMEGWSLPPLGTRCVLF